MMNCYSLMILPLMKNQKLTSVSEHGSNDIQDNLRPLPFYNSLLAHQISQSNQDIDIRIQAFSCPKIDRYFQYS